MDTRKPLLVLTLAFSLAALPSITGCKRLVRALGKAAASKTDAGTMNSEDTETSGASASEEPNPDELIGNKLNPYIDCINSLSDRFHDSASRYYEWVDPQKGPTGKERNVKGLYSISDPSGCTAGITKAKSMKPSMPDLEAAGDAYAAAVTAGFPVLKEADDYYDQRNYADDKMAKGRALHPKLVASFDAFEQADKALRAQVDTLNRQVKERTLARLEKTEGKKLPYWRSTVMLLAEDVVKLGDTHPIDKIDLPKFTAKIEEYEKAVNEFSNYMVAHKDEASKYVMITTLESESKSFLTAAKELMRRVRDKVPYSTGDKMNLGGSGEWMVNGSPGKLVRSYNELVRHSNMVSHH